MLCRKLGNLVRKGEIMINSNAYNYINVLSKAADASWTRNEIITNNLANVDTPGYKRKDVSFQNYLLQELTSGDSTSLRTRINDVEVGNLNATVYTDFNELSYRLDGNNVDVDTENVEFASNQLYYQTVLDTINHQFSMLKAAMQK